MLISRNTCKTRLVPSSLFAVPPARFPLEAQLEREPGLHSTAKKRSKGGSRVARNANVYARFCAVVSASPAQGHVYGSERGEGGHLRTRAPVSRVSVAEEEPSRRRRSAAGDARL